MAKSQSKNPELVMKWGKYKDRTIERLPSSYLSWLAENSNHADIQEAAESEYNWRSDHNDHWEE